MKTRNKSAYLFPYIASICFLGLINVGEFKMMFFFSVLFAAIAVLYHIKNIYVAYALSALLMLIGSVYNVYYAIFTLPVYLLIIIYRNIIKRINISDGKKTRNSDMSYTGLHILLLLGVGEGVFALVKYFKNDYYAYYGDSGELVVIAVALVIISMLGFFSKSLKREVQSTYKVNDGVYVTLNLVNFVGMFLFAATVFLNYAIYQDSQMGYSVICFPWSVWLCVFTYEKNPLKEAMFILIEKELKKISERRIKEK